MSNKFNPTAVEGINQDTVESDGQQYPAISFHSGDPKLKKAGGVEYEGGWFISEEGAPADMTQFGWKKDSFTTANGKEVSGYWASKIELAVICQRKRWLLEDQSYAWNDYEKAKKTGDASKKTPRGHQQYLVLLKGAENLGPFVIGMKGHAGMSFGGSKQYSSTGALSCFNRTVIAAANAATKDKGKWPFRAFWLPVGAAKTAKGEPAFTEVGTAPNVTTIVLPCPIGLPEKAGEVDLDQFYVGDSLLLKLNQLFTEVQPWATAWASFNGTQQNGKTKPAVEPEPEATEEDLAEMGV
jgi:hypothetical protein